ncbi:unnamed protein product [Psylliodes chrysocephalus]|uniref:Uncharacterized protein n=1 Tax=Psylliodes chrysocephalus TaxID=3402493 RepID=A0A9P0D7P4_9CUCU|nr:unnamed protein product [Psylliodes chrysocephala]
MFLVVYFASLKNKIDIEKALSYPLAPIPFSPCHTDGSICKTPKSVVIIELLQYQSEIVNPPDAVIHLVDGFYLLHTLKNVPNSYESDVTNEQSEEEGDEDETDAVDEDDFSDED